MRRRVWIDPDLTVVVVPGIELSDAERAEQDYLDSLTPEDVRAMRDRAMPCKIVRRMPLRLRLRRWRRRRREHA